MLPADITAVEQGLARTGYLADEGLATAMVIEDDYRGSTMLAAAGVGLLTILARGPRRTVAGFRELRWHRAALAREAAHGLGEAAYLSDLVAAYGAGALRVLCADYVRSGALAPLAPSYEPPVRAPEPVPTPLAHVVNLPRPRSVPRFEVTLPRYMGLGTVIRHVWPSFFRKMAVRQGG